MFKKIVLALCIIGVATAQENFKDCLQKDSISCVQLAVRQMDYFFVFVFVNEVLNWVIFESKLAGTNALKHNDCQSEDKK